MLVVSGDWHGDWRSVIKEIKRLDIRNCTLIQAGDFGMGFEPKKKDLAALAYLNKVLKPRNIQLYAIRGNHDNPSFYDGSVSTSNIKLIPDYTILNVDGLNILCVGGAISVDRKPNPNKPDFRGHPWPGRTDGKNYWSDEVFVLKPELCKDLNNIDVVVTHSAPDFAEPRTKSGLSDWAVSDKSLIEDCAKERNDHSKLYDLLIANKCPLKYWFYGHFHWYKREEFENTTFVLLDVNMFYDVRI